MKIYFSGSVRGGRSDRALYAEIIELLKKHGEVLTEHLGKASISHLGEIDLKEQDVYNRDMELLNQAHVIVAEVTTPSLGVGYEIASAEHLNIPTLCLYRPGPDHKLSNMIAGSPHVTVRDYQTIEDVPRILEEFFKQFN